MRSDAVQRFLLRGRALVDQNAISANDKMAVTIHATETIDRHWTDNSAQRLNPKQTNASGNECQWKRMPVETNAEFVQQLKAGRSINIDSAKPLGETAVGQAVDIRPVRCKWSAACRWEPGELRLESLAYQT